LFEEAIVFSTVPVQTTYHKPADRYILFSQAGFKNSIEGLRAIAPCYTWFVNAAYPVSCSPAYAMINALISGQSILNTH
jgi:hypothetical protein